MAEPESILQLGIEAARDGNKEEARDLFRLLTRQEPDNAQAWLWLAGVAENREERQAALERVLALEPDNDMALKGLQALGVRPVAARGAAAPVATPPPVATPAAPPPASSVDDDPFADDPFAELDNLSDVMAADESGPVRRSEPVNRDAEVAAAAAAGAAAGSAAARRDRYDDSPRPSRVSRYDDDDDGTVPARRGLSGITAILIGLVVLALIGLLIAFFWNRLFPPTEIAGNPAAEATSQAATAIASQNPTSAPLDETGTTDPNATSDTGAGTTDPNAEPTVDPNAEPPADPNAQPTSDPGAGGEAPPVDLSQANPAVVPANTPLSADGWLYDFNQPTYAAPIIGNLGAFTPNNGRFVVVLAFVVNNTGNPQSIPANFFVLKDAQGRVWEARPEVSEAYVIPGVNADLAQTGEIPPDGLTRSVAIIFDVAPDATDLVFFARSNPGQGWLVLQSV